MLNRPGMTRRMTGHYPEPDDDAQNNADAQNNFPYLMYLHI